MLYRNLSSNDPVYSGVDDLMCGNVFVRGPPAKDILYLIIFSLLLTSLSNSTILSLLYRQPIAWNWLYVPFCLASTYISLFPCFVAYFSVLGYELCPK